MNAHNFKVDRNIIHAVPLSLIFRRPKWNSRFGRAGDSVEEGGFKGQEGLIESIVTRGQDEAVCLRVNPDYQKKGTEGAAFPYEAVTGFGRIEAIRSTAANENAKLLKEMVDGGVITHERMVSLIVPDPTVRATIEEMSDEEARARNIEENVTRSQLSKPDFAWGVADLKKVSHAPGGSKMSDAQIAKRYGCSQAHISTIIRIYESPLARIRLSEDETGDRAMGLLDHWRGALVKLPYREMDLLTKMENPEAMKRAYVAQAGVKRRGEGAKSGVSGGKGKGADNAAERVKAIGAMMGSLARQRVLTVREELFSTAFACELAAPVQKFNHANATDEQLDAIIKAFEKSFKEARDTIPPEETEEARTAAKEEARAKAEAERAAKAAKEAAEKAKADAKAAAAKAKADEKAAREAAKAAKAKSVNGKAKGRAGATA
jgi:hypothetical protein